MPVDAPTLANVGHELDNWARTRNEKPLELRVFDGRYWARTSDPQLVELVLSQLS
jgi:hypothetical protein